MSYSLESIFKTTYWAISRHSEALNILQQKAATGQDLSRVSDDPSHANQILGFQSDQRKKEVYLNTMEEAISVLDLSSSVVQSIMSEMANARASLASTMSGTTSSQVRRTLATELNNALEQVVSFANSERLGQYLFAGANSEQAPYQVERDGNGQIIRVNYQGSQQEQNVEIIQGMELSALLVGDQLFRDDSRQTPVFYGSTGVAAGSGTSSVRGDVYLTVAGSPGNYQLSIDGGASWMTVDGTETNVAVVNSQTGEVLYVDATGIQQTGTEPVRVPGTYDIFNILIYARDLLNNNQNLDDETLDELMAATLTSMQEVEEKLTRSFPVIGGRIETLSNLKDSVEDLKVNSEDEVSRLLDADITQLAIDLARHQMLYEMSLTAASKIFSTSLLDFLE
ncbi:MAG TPA: flagellar hook-associated protein FlgL [Anaerohalosphaeraceae bacterium]|nr:flagellar hook-associated protein FlgL [Anaerohalosphaeraceae bacterium]HQG04674.1 flagellar hook-associated protein FlgL [Anaerohalosphaeraceae bacterium]HQI06496.1 flagellar hook-associated protein FlgL [Anaerohalosphaeraceae bacterium]HQJ66769.1 flagellar hook-associated protein FlgL [Anaerohalosphaeraceae bacterium]